MIEAALSMAKVQFAHNRWANERLLDALKAMPAEHYNATPCSGNGPIAATTAHLVLVQQSWMAWLNGNMTLGDAIAITRATGGLSDAAAVQTRWLQVDEETNEFLDSLTDEAFVTERAFEIPGRISSALPLWEMLLQLTSHGVHTRAQIVSAIRSTGAQPPEVGFLRFCMETRAASVAEVAEDEDED